MNFNLFSSNIFFHLIIIQFILTGIGLDSAIIPLKHKDLFLVQSVDFFYPLCDDAKLMGEHFKFANIRRQLFNLTLL